MASATLSTIDKILKDVYMGGRRIEAVPVKAWTCSKHRSPHRDKYVEVCLHEELTGEPCPDPYECPHAESRNMGGGCPECKNAEYVTVIDAMTGEEVWKAKLFTDIEWMLNRESVLLKVMLKQDTNRTHYGESS